MKKLISVPTWLWIAFCAILMASGIGNIWAAKKLETLTKDLTQKKKEKLEAYSTGWEDSKAFLVRNPDIYERAKEGS